MSSMGKEALVETCVGCLVMPLCYRLAIEIIRMSGA